MMLRDLSPELAGSTANGVLWFDCPRSGCEHQVRVPISQGPYHERDVGGGKVKVWQATGEFPDSLSLIPSVNVGCWHGFVQNGEVK